MKIADNLDSVFGTVSPPPQVQSLLNKGGGTGAGGLSAFLSLAIQLIYTVGGIVFVFMLLIGAFQRITSGGEKEKVKASGDRISHAIIGIVLLALAFVILRVLGSILGFSFFNIYGSCSQIPGGCPNGPGN
jgi:uncharacterized membrane protein